MSEILRCEGLSKSYGKKEALIDLDLKIESGKIIGLLGPNGSGKTTLIKLACGLLTPTKGKIFIDNMEVGTKTKSIVSYLPERNYIPMWMTVENIIDFFGDFYEDFDKPTAYNMLKKLNISHKDRMKTLSKGTKEKVQLILVMSRRAKLYLLDEPIAGVDPAARDYIMDTILTNYNPEAAVIISTHLIQDIEKILDDVIMIQYGHLKLHGSADDIRAEKGKSIDEVFREVFRC